MILVVKVLFILLLVAPVCHPGQTKVFGVGRQETIKISCELEGNPKDITFTWKFNNSMEAIDISQDVIDTQQSRSIISYTPVTESDYGTLLCWGSNEQGTQIDPCVFHVVPAGKFFYLKKQNFLF